MANTSYELSWKYHSKIKKKKKKLIENNSVDKK